tara:strand:- start:225 stop:416 length:192 start_codon:yes stop_codon:yes gene_type:complete
MGRGEDTDLSQDFEDLQESGVRVREYVGQELISDETFNIETDMSGMMVIITQARRNSEKTDEK